MRVLKYIGYIILGLIIFIVGFIFILKTQRDTSIKIENIRVSENIILPIEIMHSQRKYFGGHGFGWGGGHQKNGVEFEYKKKQYEHKTPYIPITIKYENERFYIVYYDRETDINNTTFRFFKSTKKGKFEEINTSDFPKHLAIQNRWFTNENKQENLLEMDPEKLLGTMTVDIWYMIEGKKALDGYDASEIDFIKEYKEKYIK